jgi:hypothetical protein
LTTASDVYKAIVVAILIADISVFSEVTMITLLTLVLGGIMILLGIFFLYRPSALLGTLVVAVGGASSMQFTSILDVGTVLTAFIGLLLPVLLLSLHALGVESEEIGKMAMKSRPALTAVLFGAICILSAPLVSAGISIFMPTMSMRLSTMSEIAIMLLVTVAGVLYLTRHSPTRRTIEGGSAIQSGEEQVP